MIVEFPSEAIQPWTFLCRKFLNYRYYSTFSDQSLQIICFFFTQFWKAVCFWKLVHFFWLSNLLAYNCHSIFLKFFPAVWVVISPLSFLILLIWVLFIFFLVSLARDLSILFILSKNQLLGLTWWCSGWESAC